jgi:hypothetical protein
VALALALSSSRPFRILFGLLFFTPFLCATAALFAISYQWPLVYRVGTIVIASVFSVLCFGLLLMALTSA